MVLTQIGHTPVRVEAQGQTAVQCRQNEILQMQKNSNRAVLTQIGHEPGRLEAQGKKQLLSAGRAILRSSRIVAGQCQIGLGMQPCRLEGVTTESREVRVSNTSHLT